MKTVFSSWAPRAMSVGDQVMTALGHAIYAVTIEVDQEQTAFHPAQSGWLNSPAAVRDGLLEKSRSPMVAFWKAGELIACHQVGTQSELVRCTPIFTDEKMRGTGWLGGVQVDTRIIATSGRPQHHDRLISTIMHAATFKEWAVRFEGRHHTGGIPDTPVVVLQARYPAEVLHFISAICEVPIKESFWNKLNWQKTVFVPSEPGDDRTGPKAIGVSVIGY